MLRYEALLSQVTQDDPGRLVFFQATLGAQLIVLIVSTDVEHFILSCDLKYFAHHCGNVVSAHLIPTEKRFISIIKTTMLYSLSRQAYMVFSLEAFQLAYPQFFLSSKSQHLQIFQQSSLFENKLVYCKNVFATKHSLIITFQRRLSNRYR